MAGKKDRTLWQCDECGNKNVLNAAAYQSISCPACNTRYAIVRVEGNKLYCRTISKSADRTAQ